MKLGIINVADKEVFHVLFFVSDKTHEPVIELQQLHLAYKYRFASVCEISNRANIFQKQGPIQAGTLRSALKSCVSISFGTFSSCKA